MRYKRRLSRISPYESKVAAIRMILWPKESQPLPVVLNATYDNRPTWYITGSSFNGFSPSRLQETWRIHSEAQVVRDHDAPQSGWRRAGLGDRACRVAAFDR